MRISLDDNTHYSIPSFMSTQSINYFIPVSFVNVQTMNAIATIKYIWANRLFRFWYIIVIVSDIVINLAVEGPCGPTRSIVYCMRLVDDLRRHGEDPPRLGVGSDIDDRISAYLVRFLILRAFES